MSSVKLIFLLIVVTNSVVSVAQNLETKIDDFYTEYLERLNAIRQEKNDVKALALIKTLQADFSTKAKVLRDDINKNITALADDQLKEWEDRMQDKPYLKDLAEIAFDTVFIKRINANAEMKQAFEELSEVNELLKNEEHVHEVDHETTCFFTLNGATYKNKTFNLVPENIKIAEAIVEDHNLTLNVEGIAGKDQVGLSFIVEGEKVGTYKWIGDYNLTVTLYDGTNEWVYGGHEGNGSITVERLEGLDGWVSGKFTGKLIPDGGAATPIQVTGVFKVRRAFPQDTGDE